MIYDYVENYSILLFIWWIIVMYLNLYIDDPESTHRFPIKILIILNLTQINPIE